MGIFSELYRKLPDITYNLGTINETVKDITIRFKLKYNLEYTNDFFDTHFIEKFERPDQIAQRYYNDPNLAWVVVYFNNVYDIYNEMPLAQVDLEDYIKRKYKKEIQKQEEINKTQRKLDFERVSILRSLLPEKLKELESFNVVLDNKTEIDLVLKELEQLRYNRTMLDTVELQKYIKSIEDFNKEKARLKEIELRKKESSLDLFSLYDIDFERIQTLPEISKTIDYTRLALVNFRKEESRLTKKIRELLESEYFNFDVAEQTQYDVGRTSTQNLKNYILNNFTRYNIETGSSFLMFVDSVGLDVYSDYNFDVSDKSIKYDKIVSAHNNISETKNLIDRSRILIEETARSFISLIELNFRYKTTTLSSAKLLSGRISSGNYNITDLVDKITTDSFDLNSVLEFLQTIVDFVNLFKSNKIGFDFIDSEYSRFVLKQSQIFSMDLYKSFDSKLKLCLSNINRDSNALSDLELIYQENTQYKNSVLSDTEKQEVYDNYLLCLEEIVRIDALDYKKTNIYNIQRENEIKSIESLDNQISNKRIILFSYGWTEKVYIDIKRIQDEILEIENEIYYLTERKQYPDYLNKTKLYLDKTGTVVYLDPEQEQLNLQLVNNGTFRAISHRDHEYAVNEQKRTLYLLKPQYIDALMELLKQQSKLMLEDV